MDTKITPTRKRDRAGAVSGSDANPHSSPTSAPDSHDAKRVKRPVAVRWEPGMSRYADDEEFVPADNEDDDVVETVTPRGHGASFGKKIVIMPLPKSLAEFSKADKYLWDKRASGTSYELILPTFRTLASMPSMGHSTLATRYVRLQALFATWPAPDDALLLSAKKTVEEIVEKEKWGWVKTVMEKERGGNRHEGKWEKVALGKRWEVLVGVRRIGGSGDADSTMNEGIVEGEGGERGNLAVGEEDGDGEEEQQQQEEES